MALTLIGSETWSAIAAIAGAVSAISATIALLYGSRQVYLLKQQISDDLAWKQREKALLFSQVYHPEIITALLNLSTKLAPLNISKRKKPIPLNELRSMIDKDKTIKDDIRKVLLYFENIGLAVNHDVADFSMIYDINGTGVIHVCELFSEYINDDRAGNPRTWKGIDDLVKRLTEERSRLPVSVDATMFG